MGISRISTRAAWADLTGAVASAILNALASSAVSEKNAHRCLNALSKLRGCEMHTTHLMTEGNEKTITQMGLVLTTDAKLPFPDYRPT